MLFDPLHVSYPLKPLTSIANNEYTGLTCLSYPKFEGHVCNCSLPDVPESVGHLAKSI